MGDGAKKGRIKMPEISLIERLVIASAFVPFWVLYAYILLRIFGQ